MTTVGMLGTLPFGAIGLFIGARVSGRAAPAFVNLAYIPLMYLSGLFFPIPPSIRWIALFSPAFHLNQLALHVAGAPSLLGPAINVAALAGVTVIFAGLTVRRLSRRESRQRAKVKSTGQTSKVKVQVQARPSPLTF